MLEIEIIEVNIIEGGVEVFARAWNENGQIGFGKDGTVDIERFRIFNPPVLVADDNGNIERGGEFLDSIQEDSPFRYYREDAEEALLQSLEQTINTISKHGSSKIVSGKRGNTTTTFYPDASTESTSVDGYTTDDNSSTTARTWAQVHDSDGTQSRQSANDSSTILQALADTGYGRPWIRD